MTKTWAMIIGAVALSTLGFGCRRAHNDASVTERSHCATLSETFVADLMATSPLGELPEDLRDALARTLSGKGRVCLDAPATSRSCNAGDARNPDVRSCCHFADAPRARLLGVARRVKLAGADGTIVELNLIPSLSRSMARTTCLVPSCTDDSVTARGVLKVRGSVTRPAGTTSVAIELQLDSPLALDCRLAA